MSRERPFRGWLPTVCCLAMLCTALGFAQEARAQVNQERLTTKVAFDNIVKGLPHEALTSIVQDDAGFLWFGTYQGLARYDGYDFKAYSSQTHTGLPDELTITALATDKEGLWIGTSGAGVYRLDFDSDSVTQIENLTSTVVQALALDQGGNLWVGTTGGVDIVNPKNGDITVIDENPEKEVSLSSNSVTSILAASDGQVWIGTADGLNRISKDRSRIDAFYAKDDDEPDDTTLSLAGRQVASLLEDRGIIWVGTEAGLTAINTSDKTSRHYFTGSNGAGAKWVTAMTIGQDNALWLGTRGSGVVRFDLKTGGIAEYRDDPNDPESIINVFVRSAFSDRTGVLWFGFSANGVSKTNLLRREFGFYPGKPGLSFLEQGDSLWIGSTGEGLRRFDTKTGRVEYFLVDALSPTWTMQIKPSKDGSLWLGTTDKGLYKFDPTTGEAIHFEDVPSASAVVPDGDNLWVGTLGIGLHYFDASNDEFSPFAIESDEESKSLSSNMIYAVHRDTTNPNFLWVGTASGLDRVQINTREVVQFHHKEGDPNSLCHDHVTDIYQGATGYWIATWGGGICKFDADSGTFKTYNEESGLPVDVVYRVLGDDEGNLWMSTNSGIVRFATGTDTATVFRAGDGLQQDEFGQASGYKGKDGRLYFGGPKGFNAFFPSAIGIDSKTPQLAFTGLEIVGEARKSIPNEIELTYQDPMFTLSFASLSFADSNRNRYRYRLKGIHDWIETDRRYVSYSTLPSGDYSFEVQGSNHHGVWNNDGIVVGVHMAPPPWKSWWAYTIYALLVGLLIFAWILRQRRKLQELSKNHRLSELEKEMELTSAVQEGFLPASAIIQLPGFSLEGFYKPALACSGDWWWYEKREETYFIIVADVTGHGAGPAMVTAAVAASFRSTTRIKNDEERIQEINAEVCRISDGKYFMTMTAIEINPTTGAYKLYFAGGLPALTYKAGSRPRSLISSGTPLGTRELRVGTVEGQLVPGERLMLLTDGIPEVETGSNRLFGVRRLCQVYAASELEIGGSIKQIVDTVSAALVGPQDDDWTMIMLEWQGAAKTDLRPQ